MQALVLAGGEGTRLRPLTYTTPKPVMPLAGRPFLSFMLDWLRAHGVEEVILSCGFMSEDVKRVLGDIYDGMRLRYVVEDEPLGTAGPVRLALDEGVLEDRLLILNGDVLTDIDLTAELGSTSARRRARRSRSTAVEDTASYGVVLTDADGRVTEFIEKGEGDVPSNRINAGAYVIERDVAEAIPPAARSRSSARSSPAWSATGCTATSPRATGSTSGRLTATWRPPGTCSPAGSPRGCRRATRPARSSTRAACCLARTSARRACSAATARSGSDSRVERSVLHDRVRVGADAVVVESILGEGVRVGERALLEPGAIAGAGAVIGDGAVIGSGARLEPGAEVPPGARVEAVEPVR